MERVLTPLQITLLIHIHCFSEPIENAEYPAQKVALQLFLDTELICANLDSRSGFETTERGAKLVQMLTETPLPQEAKPRWCDPRTGD